MVTLLVGHVKECLVDINLDEAMMVATCLMEILLQFQFAGFKHFYRKCLQWLTLFF